MSRLNCRLIYSFSFSYFASFHAFGVCASKSWASGKLENCFSRVLEFVQNADYSWITCYCALKRYKLFQPSSGICLEERLFLDTGALCFETIKIVSTEFWNLFGTLIIFFIEGTIVSSKSGDYFSDFENIFSPLCSFFTNESFRFRNEKNCFGGVLEFVFNADCISIARYCARKRYKLFSRNCGICLERWLFLEQLWVLCFETRKIVSAEFSKIFFFQSTEYFLLINEDASAKRCRCICTLFE